ncbi:MAG: endolytic transglycosylase MltG, partial [Bacteroidota bacterium]
TPQEVYTLASIVEKETLQKSEKARIAGVYLNRLSVGMPLQADPTAVFARKDFLARRVTDFHTKFDSPYNTYKYPGLPPGPITMSSISSIDAVINYEKHDFLYFCAIGDESGLHAFATNLSEHNKNARNYRDNLIKRGLR